MNFYDQIARHILSRHEAPDLRGATLLLPGYHVALPLAQALARVSGTPALLLPQLTTLGDWAQSVSLPAPIQSDTSRIAALYQALRGRSWFPDADLWSLSRELLALMDELTCHHVALPDDAEAFAAQLAAAYQARSGQALMFEARVVHELWYAMAAAGDLDATRAYQQRLALLAQQVERPLYVLQTCELAAPERRFVDACRERVEVTVFDLRELAKSAPNCALLVAAMQQEADAANLVTMAADLRDAEPLDGRLRLFGAQGLEQEAEADDVQVRRWLLEGKQRIAVVVQDRLVARRLRALLERAAVQVQDETGWTFATLSVSTVLMRWLEAVQGDFYYQDVLDLLKSPLLFADDPAMRRQAAYLFEQMVRRHGVVAHLQDYLALAERHAKELVKPLARLRQAKLAMPVGARRLADWLAQLDESLEILGVTLGWQQDAAGQQLMQLLALWREELQSDPLTCSFAEWRRWLAQQLDLNTYRDMSVESPVLFTHLSATRWRSFDAVLLLGCDARHLPAPANAGQWFNDAVRAALGLPLSGEAVRQVRDDLLGLLALNDTVLATWQTEQGGEPNLLSPWLEMLRALHRLAVGSDLMDGELGTVLGAARVRAADDGVAQRESVMPRPAVAAGMLPQRISPSGYNALVACPYQYYARHVLRLNELDEVREELDKRDYGIWVHAVLQRFHAEVPLLANCDDAQAVQVMQRISQEVFAEALAHDYLAQAWWLRWQAMIPGYLEWQRDHEREGWRYRAAEQDFTQPVNEALVLKGRLDRVDALGGELAVLDYKTQSVTALKSRLKAPGEDVQLACYAGAVGAVKSAFVSLDGDKVQTVEPEQDVSELARLNAERLATVFGQMRGGAPLPAHGAEKVCGYCEMRGLCRRGEWEQAGKGEGGTGREGERVKGEGGCPQGVGRAVPVASATTATLREKGGARG